MQDYDKETSMTLKKALQIGIIISVLGGPGQCGDTKEQELSPTTTTQHAIELRKSNSRLTQLQTHLHKDYKGISYGTLYGVSLISSGILYNLIKGSIIGGGRDNDYIESIRSGLTILFQLQVRYYAQNPEPLFTMLYLIGAGILYSSKKSSPLLKHLMTSGLFIFPWIYFFSPEARMKHRFR